MEKRHSEHCSRAQVELRKELDELQQQFMMEMQKEEVAQMQKYFQSMLLMWIAFVSSGINLFSFMCFFFFCRKKTLFYYLIT